MHVLDSRYEDRCAVAPQRGNLPKDHPLRSLFLADRPSGKPESLFEWVPTGNQPFRAQTFPPANPGSRFRLGQQRSRTSAHVG